MSMKKLPVLRLYPKLKLFVNGYYVYNPTISESSLRNLRSLIGTYTSYIHEVNLGGMGSIGGLFSQRAIISRFLLTDRRRLIQYKKRMK